MIDCYNGVVELMHGILKVNFANKKRQKEVISGLGLK